MREEARATPTGIAEATIETTREEARAIPIGIVEATIEDRRNITSKDGMIAVVEIIAVGAEVVTVVGVEENTVNQKEGVGEITGVIVAVTSVGRGQEMTTMTVIVDDRWHRSFANLGNYTSSTVPNCIALGFALH
mmetsp:Transcript_11873/g.27521  ORF Transcript_11873/g.27521 Transcript_11873/m.27521 type:complete len:135 (-) Transcript_11873:1910-2314(-)